MLVHGKYFLPFLEILELKRSLVEDQQMQQKDRKKWKRKSEQKKIENEKPEVVRWFSVQKPSQNFDLCARPSKKVMKHGSSEMQGPFLCFKGRFEWLEAISAHTRP